MVIKTLWKFCIFPFVVDFMMRFDEFDDNCHVHTFELPPLSTKMIVSMQFDEKKKTSRLFVLIKRNGLNVLIDMGNGSKFWLYSKR